jgi:hypothetical protein
MRYLFGFLCVCAVVGTLPLSVSAQAGEEDTTSEPNLEEPAPSSEPAPEEPALQLKLDDAGVEVVPSLPRTPDGYTFEEMELRVQRAKIGLGFSAVFFVVGVALATAGGVSILTAETSALLWSGVALGAGGGAGMIASGILLRKRKRDRDSLREAHHGKPRRVQWDLARSRFVF